MRKIKIAPSILSADFSKMGEEVKNLEESGADLVHCDVMDGVFVNNITFGIKMVEDIRKRTSLPLDCHLMIVQPEKYVERFVKAGADIVTVMGTTNESTIRGVIDCARGRGKKSFIDTMCVEPIEEACGRYAAWGADYICIHNATDLLDIDATLALAKRALTAIEPERLVIAGGVNERTAHKLQAYAPGIVVVGSAIAKSADPRATALRLRDLAAGSGI